MPEPLKVVDYIELFNLTTQGIIEKAASFYEKGWSLREIATELSVGKTQVRKLLLKSGTDLRPSNGRPQETPRKTVKRHIGVAPFGFYSHMGQLHEDPKEQLVVQKIMRLRSKGLRLNEVAKELNRQKIKTRSGGQWDHSIIRNIVQRHEKSQEQTKRRKDL